MRVTVVDPPAYTPPYDHCLCEALARRGLEVELATSRFEYGPVPEPTGYRRRQCFYRLGGGRRWKGLQHSFDMRRLAREQKNVDVVHFQWLPVPHLDRRLVRRFPSPRVFTAHDLWPREAGARARGAIRSLFDRMDAIVVHSRSGRARLVSELNMDAERVHVIPHGCFVHLTSQDGSLDAIAGPLDGRRVVLFFGLIRPYKGLDLLVEALADLPEDVVLLVAGMPRMSLDPILERASQLGLGERLRLVPRFVADHEVAAYFRRAEVVVLPYRESEQSGVLFTSLAFGKPTIVSDVGGFAEVARDHGAAELVPAGDVGALHATIYALLEDEARRERLSRAALAAAEGPYSWDRSADLTERLYRQLLAGRTG